jgi:uncharacterized protein (TIGR03435 family)
MISITALLLFICISLVNAQVARPPEFDVATVKAVAITAGQPININLGTARNGKVTLGNVTLSDAIRFAYDMGSDAQIFGPEWIKSGDVRFEIVGQAAPDTSQEQLLAMLRTLLAERLKLSTSREKRELPHLALTVARNGPKLASAGTLDDTPPRLGLGRIAHNQMPVSVLAMLISRFERQIVMNLTQISGFFSINLQWTPELFRGKGPADGSPIVVNGEAIDANGPSLYTAIQEQLGLRLEARKGPVDVIVVDHAEKVPVEN